HGSSASSATGTTRRRARPIARRSPRRSSPDESVGTEPDPKPTLSKALKRGRVPYRRLGLLPADVLDLEALLIVRRALLLAPVLERVVIAVRAADDPARRVRAHRAGDGVAVE